MYGRRRALRGLAVGFLALSCFLASASAAEAELVFKRPNGSVIQFKGTPHVWCGPWDSQVARPSIHVELRSAKRAWELSAVQRDVKVGRRIKFPNQFVSKRPHGAFLFAYERKPLIEASTSEEESSGSMVFSQMSCDLGGIVEFKIHAVLGSEFFNGIRPRVNGIFRGEVEAPPPTPMPGHRAE